jgi:alpha-glucosidase (family GH31 glycosyl hydrolase)
LSTNLSGNNFLVDPKTIPLGKNNRKIEKVKFKFGQATFGRSFLSLASAEDNVTRWDIPDDLVARDHSSIQGRLNMSNFEANLDPFWFKLGITSDGNREVLIDTENQAFVFLDKYIQLDMKLPTQKIFGFGQLQGKFSLGEGAHTMWSQDSQKYGDDLNQSESVTGGGSGSGVHPFCLVKAKTANQFFGIYFRNANAQTAVIQHLEDGTSKLSYITTGGNLDVVFFLSGGARDIVKQYHQFIGLPALAPYWSLGWHFSGNFGSLDEL